MRRPLQTRHSKSQLHIGLTALLPITAVLYSYVKDYVASNPGASRNDMPAFEDFDVNRNGKGEHISALCLQVRLRA